MQLKLTLVFFLNFLDNTLVWRLTLSVPVFHGYSKHLRFFLQNYFDNYLILLYKEINI